MISRNGALILVPESRFQRLFDSFDVPGSDVDGESLRAPSGVQSEENCLWFAEYCRGLDRPDAANRDFWNVHAVDLPSGDDGIAFAISNFSYPQTHATLNA